MRKNEVEALALDALDLVRNGLLVNLRFMSAAFARLAPLPVPGATLATDGAHLRFDPVTWARTYANDPAEASRAYLHTVLHNVFLHLYPGAGIDPLLWDIACDMVVESVIDQLDLPATRTAQAAASRPELERMAEEAGLMTAERVYAALRDQRAAGATDDELARLGRPSPLACRHHCRRRRRIGQDGRGNRRRGSHERSRRQGRYFRHRHGHTRRSR